MGNTPEDLCVKCGLCLPHCPTFTLTQDENRSPRGRITVIQGLTNGGLTPGTHTASALDSCLSCYRCQAVCPAEVPFADIIDKARALWAPTKLGIFRWIDRPFWIPLFHNLLWGLDLSRLRPLARKSGLLRLFKLSRADLLLPGPTPRRRTFKDYYPPLSAPQGEVSLFLGCLSQISLHDLFHDSILLLQQLGYGVHIPLKQACCGALFQHTGHLKQAQKCQEQNQSVFTAFKGIPMLTFATGCQRDLKDTHPKSIDIMSFLATVSWPTHWHCAPLAKTFVIQAPCSTHASEKAAVYSLLTKIPNIRLENLPYSQCCGAAGIQMLTNPAQADALGLAWLQEMQKIPGITGIVTTNIGCQMHLARLSRQNRPEIPFLHPLSLFLTQLNRKERTFPLDKTTQ